MSAENDWFEYHLTPEGWLAGSKTIGHIRQIEEIPIPCDRVLTIRFRTNQSCLASKTRHWHEVDWEHANHKIIDTLKEQFGSLPEQYKEWTVEGFVS